MVNSFYEQYQKMNTDYSDTVAFRWVDADGKSVRSRTYGEFCTDIRRYTAYLKDKLGELNGKHIAILSQNNYDSYVAIFAGLLMNCILVPLNFQKDLSEILDEMERADVTAVICSAEITEWLPELSEKAPGTLIGLSAYKDYLESEIPDNTDPEALVLIIYTSGTTGLSKGVMISQRNIISSFGNIFKSEKTTLVVNNKLFSFLVALPLFHIAGFSSIENLFFKNTICICESPRYLYRDILLLSPAYTIFVPAMFKPLYQELKNGRKEKLGTLRGFVTAGASADIESRKCLMENGYAVAQTYAMTETTAAGTFNASQDIKYIESIGKPDGVVQVRLVDGELCLKGETIFMGYYNDPEGTAEVFDEDGWFHTGDLARVDEDGYYYLTGRKKNLIILSGGENVSPEELENKLLENRNILEVVVKEKNRHIAAEIFCAAEKRQEIEDFVTELNKTLPTYKLIAEVEFRDTPFERTSTGKIKR